MTGLTTQLQSDAVDQNVSVSSLLRKVKIAAVKLRLEQVVDWADAELNGYDGDHVPDYRNISGRPKVNIPRQGWVPFHSDHPSFMETISTTAVREPITSLEDTIGDPNRTGFYLPFPPAATHQLNQLCGTSYPDMGLHVGRSALSSIIERVRTLVLDWSLELEKNDILGEGMSFSSKEKDDASKASVSIGAIYGNYNSNTGSTHGSASPINVGSVHGDASVFLNVSEAVKSGVADSVERDNLLQLIESMKSAPDPVSYSSAYKAFISSAADHITVIAPFIPALTALVAS